jgi:hypothetical protein
MGGLQNAQASEFVRRSQEFFRIKTVLESSGDIFEVDTGLRGFVIGPDSDIAEVIVYHYEPTEPELVQAQTVSINNPFVGRLDALMGIRYPGETPARTLFSVNDIIEQNYFPKNMTGTGTLDVKVQVPAIIDVQGYFAEPSQLPSFRSDKRFRLSRVPPPQGIGTKSFYIIPYYGRRYCSILVRNPETSIIGTVKVYGVRLPVGAGVASAGDLRGEILLHTFTLNGDDTLQHILLGTTDGLYDLLYLQAELNAFADVTYRIDVSDKEV